MISNYWRKKSNECTVHDSDYKTDSAAVYRGLVQATKFLAKLSASPTCNCKTYSLSLYGEISTAFQLQPQQKSEIVTTASARQEIWGEGGVKISVNLLFWKENSSTLYNM